jgi:hypothetical protein
MSTADNDLLPKARLALWGSTWRLAGLAAAVVVNVAWISLLAYGLVKLEADRRAPPSAGAMDFDQRIAGDTFLRAIDAVSSLSEPIVRAAPAAIKPTQAPNIDPSRKTIPNVMENPPQHLSLSERHLSSERNGCTART